MIKIFIIIYINILMLAIGLTLVTLDNIKQDKQIYEFRKNQI